MKTEQPAKFVSSVSVQLTRGMDEGLKSLQRTTAVDRSALIRPAIAAGLPLVLKRLDILEAPAKTGSGAPELAN